MCGEERGLGFTSKQADLGASVVVLNCHLRFENWTGFRIHGGGLGFASFFSLLGFGHQVTLFLFEAQWLHL